MDKRNKTARWTGATAKRILDEWAASGESLGAFSRRRGVQAQRLSWWRKRLGWTPVARGSTPARTASLAPVTVVGGPQSPTMSAAATIELGHSIRVEVHTLDRTSAAWVATLARALGAAS